MDKVLRNQNLWEIGNESLVYGGKESGYRGLYEILEWTLRRNLALTPTETTVLRSCLASHFPSSFGYQVAQSRISNPVAPPPNPQPPSSCTSHITSGLALSLFLLLPLWLSQAVFSAYARHGLGL